MTCSPMVLSYDGVYLWKAAVEKAKSFEVDKVREALEERHLASTAPAARSPRRRTCTSPRTSTSAKPRPTVSSRS